MARITKERKAEAARRALQRWGDDPVAFAEEVLGVKLWRKQKQILRAIAGHNRVAVRSGHKCGKTTTAAIAALWWICTRRRARVILTAPSYTQVDELLWGEVKRLYRSAKIKLGGKLGVKPETGLEFSDGRQIIGFSTDTPERAAGFSSPNILIIIDEASGFDPKIYEALLGNLAGGAHIVLISNPTQPSGFFFDAFHAASSAYVKIHMSSRECAECWPTDIGEDGQGLATIAWCDQMLADYGEDDSRYQVRVCGDFPAQGSDCMIPASMVDAATARWQPTPPDDAPLRFGVDVARFGPDWSSIVWSRGLWASVPIRMKGNDNVAVAGRVLAEIQAQRRSPTERVVVCIDTSNNGGVADIIRAANDENIEVVDMVASASAPEPTADESGADKLSDGSRLRDAVWICLRKALRTAAIPPAETLRSDLLAPKYGYDERGKLKVESKKDMRKRLGRSTDDADALALAFYRSSDNSHEVADLIFSRQHRTPQRTWT